MKGDQYSQSANRQMAEFAEHTSWLTLAVDMQLATGISLPISRGQQKGAGLLVAQARTFEKMWRHFSIFFLTEKAWDLAHVGFRAERGCRSFGMSHSNGPVAHRLGNLSTRHAIQYSSQAGQMETSRFCTPKPGSEGTGIPFLHKKCCEGPGIPGNC